MTLFDAPPKAATSTDPLYPAFESTMGDTLVRELDELPGVDMWQQAINLQLVLDRLSGLA